MHQLVIYGLPILFTINKPACYFAASYLKASQKQSEPKCIILGDQKKVEFPAVRELQRF